MGDLLGVSRSAERDFTVCSVDLSRDFPECVYCLSSLSLWIFYCVNILIICSCVLAVLVLLSVFAK